MSEKWIELAQKQQNEIERLNGVVREWERDMKGTLNTLEAERQRAAKLLEALEALTSTARTFRNVPESEQQWTSLDDTALENAFAAIAEATGQPTKTTETE